MQPVQPDDDSQCNHGNKQFICTALLWYISPISCNIVHSLLCLVYHNINFAFGLAFVIFDATAIATSLGLTALFCIGIPLLWITFEIILILSRIDLGTHIPLSFIANLRITYIYIFFRNCILYG